MDTKNANLATLLQRNFFNRKPKMFCSMSEMDEKKVEYIPKNYYFSSKWSHGDVEQSFVSAAQKLLPKNESFLHKVRNSKKI